MQRFYHRGKIRLGTITKRRNSAPSCFKGDNQTMSEFEEGKSNRGGFRPGAGRPRNVPVVPFEYLLTVMRNPKAEAAHRVHAAIALLPYYQGDAAETDPAVTGRPLGKKDAAKAKAVRIAASGRFATPPAPRLGR
jgi:hypothetical protein